MTIYTKAVWNFYYSKSQYGADINFGEFTCKYPKRTKMYKDLVKASRDENFHSYGFERLRNAK